MYSLTKACVCCDSHCQMQYFCTKFGIWVDQDEKSVILKVQMRWSPTMSRVKTMVNQWFHLILYLFILILHHLAFKLHVIQPETIRWQTFGKLLKLLSENRHTNVRHCSFLFYVYTRRVHILFKLTILLSLSEATRLDENWKQSNISHGLTQEGSPLIITCMWRQHIHVYTYISLVLGPTTKNKGPLDNPCMCVSRVDQHINLSLAK